MIVATQLKVGNTIIFNGELCKILRVDHVTPGKGHGMVQAKLRNIVSGVQFENRFRSSEKVETAHLKDKEMEYLYEDQGVYHFMNTETYEQIELNKEALDNAVNYLVENIKINISFYDGTPIGINLPNTVDLEVVETEPSMKGATATASYKPAALQTGLVVQVPQFVKIGDVIRVKTEDNTYLERAK
ncbi:MAG: elongation factor P [Pseudomonadota bacterium]